MEREHEGKTEKKLRAGLPIYGRKPCTHPSSHPCSPKNLLCMRSEMSTDHVKLLKKKSHPKVVGRLIRMWVGNQLIER